MTSEQQLQQALSELVPQALLSWQKIPDLPIEGYVLDFDSASLPLDNETSERVMQTPPFWGLLWPAGHLLCRLFVRHPHLVRDRSCVDLGCGSGLVSTALAHAGATVRAVDSDPLSCQVTRLHLERCRLAAEVTASWNGQAQTLILADFLYDDSHLEFLAGFRQRTDEILVADCRLEELVCPGFSYLGQRAEVAFPDLDPHREFGTVRIWYAGPRQADWARALSSGKQEFENRFSSGR